MIVATNQYVTFRLDDETYALDVGNAREIVEAPRLTRMPNAPSWIRGVMNLRGSVVPVIDLKQKFEMGVTELTSHSCVLLVEFIFEQQPFVIGVLVDAVLEVFELAPEAIEPPPKFGARYSKRYLRGMSRRSERVFLILNADRVFSDTALKLEADAEEPAETANVKSSDYRSEGIEEANAVVQ